MVATLDINLKVNGRDYPLKDVWIGESLLYVLRERLGLSGSKNACEQGECGSCSVLLDDTLVCSCLVLAADAEGVEVTTVEGIEGTDMPSQTETATPSSRPVGDDLLAAPGSVPHRHDALHSSYQNPVDTERIEGELLQATPPDMHPVKRAFAAAGAVQCGFCTPGLVMAVTDLLRHNPHPSELDAREAISGNLCRCTGYGRIFAAIRLAEELVQQSPNLKAPSRRAQ
ncbi:MAG: (2Fe-2S)-binding protein [Actinobacteria bacterium]|jgi:carbon-monoxide dehydrogenase small subunit|nr:(2Fe-2S)-binding protein [Actinomycetota bacterium]